MDAFISDDGTADRMGTLARLVGLVLVGCVIGRRSTSSCRLRCATAAPKESSRARKEKLLESGAAGGIDVLDGRNRGGLLLEAHRPMAEIPGADEALVPDEPPVRAGQR
ncbi:hypothetical protein [Streptomonospora wellingtoniae]|uniref:Uncharacterized protein n=1 Tax=Streptomonospora wellingtoniae TaxID=3075544 RepID=A0ABU2KPZ9_9ACTN|nr:hypothetical protein [Streptomonospora sp. DSM 45055]MDT0301338.1 hypothetical protein [Streptomonospora sp. DSM 45055]